MQEPQEPEVSRREIPPADYVNCFEVGFNRYEFLIDCSLIAPEESGSVVRRRLVTHPFHALSLLRTLQRSVEAFEESFGERVSDLHEQELDND
jgi:hypothetical protein